MSGVRWIGDWGRRRATLRNVVIEAQIVHRGSQAHPRVITNTPTEMNQILDPRSPGRCRPWSAVPKSPIPGSRSSVYNTGMLGSPPPLASPESAYIDDPRLFFLRGGGLESAWGLKKAPPPHAPREGGRRSVGPWGEVNRFGAILQKRTLLPSYRSADTRGTLHQWWQSRFRGIRTLPAPIQPRCSGTSFGGKVRSAGSFLWQNRVIIQRSW